MFALCSRLRAAPRLNLATARAKAIPGVIRVIIKDTIELSMRIDNLSGLPARAPKRPSEGHLASGAPDHLKPRGRTMWFRRVILGRLSGAAVDIAEHA